MDERASVRVEEVVRALGAAASSLRLYPPTSELPAAAVARAVEISSAVTSAAGAPVRYGVEPKAFKHGDQLIGETSAQVSGLAEALYAHQVGQLIVAPGLTAPEVLAFLQCVASDAAAVREEGGIRSVLVAAGVSHIAVIELTLRASTEEGILGLDLTSAPLEVIGPAVVRAAADWARSAASGTGRDQVGAAIDGLESAARDLAAGRIAEAMSRLDEQTRSAVLAAAVRKDTTGRAMDGMLSVIADMKPATLARLLALAAGRAGSDPASLLGRLRLPPEAARAVMLLLRPNPRSEMESGVPPTTDAAAIAGAAVDETEEDEARIRAQIAASSPALAADRALGTALALAQRDLNAEAIDAVGDAIAPALSAGAFAQVGAAITLLERAGADPTLETAVRKARSALTDGERLAAAAAHVRDQGAAHEAIPVFAAAGPTGAEALLTAWSGVSGTHKHALELVLQGDADQVLTVAGRRVRSSDVAQASDVIALLGRIGDRRAAPVLAQALENPSSDVRAAVIEALARMNTPETWRVIATTLHNPDEATARRALYEVRMARSAAAVPDLIATLGSPRPSRSWEFKREVVDCLKELRAVEAVPALKREAGHLFAFTAKRRVLRQAAREALAEILAGEAPAG